MNLLKKQGVAWLITIAMILAAICIGCSKQQRPGSAPDSYNSFVWDNARVLSDKTVRTLDQRNDWLWDNYAATIGVVTCDYNKDDLGGYAMQCAEDMGLGGYDMIVVLDIKGDNYWLIQGDDIRRDFTDQDCSDYAYDYMERDFAKGNYDKAVLNLTEALEDWYTSYYG